MIVLVGFVLLVRPVNHFRYIFSFLDFTTFSKFVISFDTFSVVDLSIRLFRIGKI